MGATTHELKTWVGPFEAIVSGKKRYEIREDDREFKIGDTLVLKEFDAHAECDGTGRVRDHTDMMDCGCPPPHGTYTGREIRVKVTYKTEPGEWGLEEDGPCVMGIAPEDDFGRALPATKPVVCTKTTGIPCYDKAQANEPVFVLRAQDLTSPAVVLEWIKLNIETAPHEKLRQALESAIAMSSYGKMGGMDGSYETKRKRAD